MIFGIGRNLCKTILVILPVFLAVTAGFLIYPLLRPVKISFKLSENMPLGGSALIETREPARVSLGIKGLDANDLKVDFRRTDVIHQIPVLGLYPGRKNRVEFIITTARGRSYTRTLDIQTPPLPEIFPKIQFERLLPELISPGMTFLHLGYYDEAGKLNPLPCAVDNFGKVRWFYTGSIGHVLKRLKNGNLLIQRDNSLVEMDMLGNPAGQTWTVATGIHHDAIELPDGNLLALSSAPGSFEDGLVEIDRVSGKHVGYWDFRKILDPQRPLQPRNLEERDWLHLNGLSYDPLGDNIVLSGRDQSAVVSIHRPTGDLRWILGSHDHWAVAFFPYLLHPAGGLFDWSWGQHAPMVNPENPNRLLVYDNGNKRSYDSPLEPGENFSRAVEYEINQETREVRQLWEYGRRYGSEWYTPFIGDANYLVGGNRLVCFGGITRDLSGQPMEIFDFEEGTINRMKISAVIAEVTGENPAREVMKITLEDPDPESYKGYRSYRAVKMPLYE